jgi:hypothetical protein
MAQVMFFICWFLVAMVMDRLVADKTVSTIFWVIALIMAVIAIVSFFTAFNPFGISLK